MRRIAGLGLGAAGLWLLWTPAALYLLFFYTEVLGIPPAIAGITFFIAMLWDAAIDPAVGIFADRMRWRYRSWIVASIIPTCFFAVLLWGGFKLDGVWLIGVTFAIHLIFRTLFTFVFVPFSATMSALAEQEDHKSSNAGAVSYGYSIGAVLVALGFLGIVRWIDPDAGTSGYQAAAGIYAILACILVIVAALLLPTNLERPAKSATPIRKLLNDRALWLVILAILLYAISFSVMLKSVPYFFKYVVEDELLTSLAMTVTMGAGILVIPLWTWLLLRVSRRKAWGVGLVLFIIGAALAVVEIPLDNQIRFTAAFFVMASGINGFIVSYLGLLMEAAHALNERLKGQTDAAVLGLGSFALKASSGGGAWILGSLLAISGFVANAPADETVRNAISIAMLLCPAIGFAIAGLAVIASGYGKEVA